MTILFSKKRAIADLNTGALRFHSLFFECVMAWIALLWRVLWRGKGLVKPFGVALVMLMSVMPLSVQARPGAGPVPVIVSVVQPESFMDQLQALGTTRANETVVITADTTEKITALHFTEGQNVAVGDLLVTLDQRQELAQLRAAKAQLAEAEAAYQRAKNLRKRSAVSAATLQERLAEKTRNEVQVDVIEARLAELRIQAPFAGRIGLRQVSIGALVKPGDPITTLDDLSQIKVDFQMPSRYLSLLKPGLAIKGSVVAFADQTFEGEVNSIDTQIDPATRTVRLRAVIPNPERLLKPGLLMRVTLTHSPRQALLIPEEALVKRGEQNFVFRVLPQEPSGDSAQAKAAHRVERQAVTLGARVAGRVELIQGVEAGDQLVVHGVNKLRPGAEVTIRAVEKADETLQELLDTASDKRGA
jgi:membrane fusion protein (multidrug efflux system)